MADVLSATVKGAGLDDLIVVSLDVREALSEPVRATLAGIADADIEGDAAIGEDVTIEVTLDGEVVRVFHLVVAEITFDGVHRGHRQRWVVELVHEIELLRHRADVRMFQEKDAKEIVTAVFAGAGIAPATFSLARTPGKRTYCVQYRESDFAFASRLLEHEGIFYFVRESADAAELVLADDVSVFSPISAPGGGDPTLVLVDDDVHGRGVRQFSITSRAVSQRCTVGDYDEMQPNLDVGASADLSSGGTYEQFEFPAGYKTPDEGAVLAKLRVEELAARRIEGEGESEVLELRAGATFDLGGETRLAGGYTLTRVEHRFVFHPSEAEGATGGGEPGYRNRFTCIPKGTRYRPPRVTPKPRLRGSHAVVVTGPSGGEIHTDELGRMKGKFFWDRLGKQDDTSSCWMRLAQLPISGSMALARVGWEMAIVYPFGDPDRPTAVARVYNAEKVSPYPYPGAATKSSMQTPSSPGGGKSNEVRLSDGAGGQELFLNSSKDFDGTTKNDKTAKIGANDTRQVGVDCQTDIGADQKVTIGANLTTQVGAAEGVAIKGSRTKSVGGSESVSVMGNVTTTIGGADAETTGGTHTTVGAMGVTRTVVGSQTLTVGGSMITAAGKDASLSVAGARSETVGAVKLVASGGPVSHSAIGALAVTVGGVIVNATPGNFSAGTKGPAIVTVGGVAIANAAGKLSIKSKQVSFTVGGIGNLLGGGGVLNMTPGSIAVTGLVKLDASGSITISGNPNLVG